MKIIVSSLAAAPRVIHDERPSHLVSLLSPEELHLAPDWAPRDRHLRIGVHDVDHATAADRPPSPGHVEDLLRFAADWSAEAPLLVHCWAGVSRSTAAAFTLACARNPETDERVIADALRAASPTAWPNTLFVAHADAALDRRGRMSAAISAIGEPDIFDDAAPFALPARFAAS